MYRLTYNLKKKNKVHMQQQKLGLSEESAG